MTRFQQLITCLIGLFLCLALACDRVPNEFLLFVNLAYFGIGTILVLVHWDRLPENLQ